jgi:hypothetical protein
MTIRRPSLFQVWKWISVLWLVVAGGLAIHNWPGEDYVKGMSFGEAPDEWRDQHPECRDRYGYWPDGQRMDRWEFHVWDGMWFTPTTLSLWDDIIPTTPEQRASHRASDEARSKWGSKWADDIREKVSACERPLWLPTAQAVVIREAQSGYIAFALLPPLMLLLIGATLIEIWTHYVKPQWLKHWQKLPQHIRTGLLRLYGVVAVPWMAWFGYRLFDALQRHNDRLASSAFWLLLIVPIGAPIVMVAVLWVIAGFRKREPASTSERGVSDETLL